MNMKGGPYKVDCGCK
uniref:Uncharacterized protein n=1 Tax=Rhizophora mucronata TaxID=61149 RepID=A0A2P2PW78_RHIMU